MYLWDLKRPLNAVNDSTVMAVYTRNEESPPPIFTFPGHQVEGFAMDWSKTTPGRLLGMSVACSLCVEMFSDGNEELLNS